MQRATPDDFWRGAAANAYGAVNADHAAVFGALAELDVRLAAEIDRSAGNVTAGRGDLDNIRDWVLSAASSVPPNRAGDAMMMSIVSSGLARIGQIVERSNGELNSVGASIEKLGAEYSALGNQKFGGRGPVPKSPAETEDDKPYDPKPIVDAATWRVEWERLQRDIDAYNRSVREFGMRPIPAPNDVPGVAAYNREVARQHVRQAGLQQRQLELVQKAAELGLPEPQIAPSGSASPDGAAPTGFVSRDRPASPSAKGLPT